MEEGKERYAIISITRNGASLGELLHGLMPAADFFVSSKFVVEGPSGTPFSTTVLDLVNVQLDGGVSKDRIGSIYQRLTLPQEDVVSLPLGELAEAGVEFTDLSIFVLPTVSQKP